MVIYESIPWDGFYRFVAYLSLTTPLEVHFQDCSMQHSVVLWWLITVPIMIYCHLAYCLPIHNPQMCCNSSLLPLTHLTHQPINVKFPRLLQTLLDHHLITFLFPSPFPFPSLSRPHIILIPRNSHPSPYTISSIA
jgi:hypothetical protein